MQLPPAPQLPFADKDGAFIHLSDIPYSVVSCGHATRLIKVLLIAFCFSFSFSWYLCLFGRLLRVSIGGRWLHRSLWRSAGCPHKCTHVRPLLSSTKTTNKPKRRKKKGDNTKRRMKHLLNGSSLCIFLITAERWSARRKQRKIEIRNKKKVGPSWVDHLLVF